MRFFEAFNKTQIWIQHGWPDGPDTATLNVKKSENEIQEGAGSQRQPIDVTITNIYTLNTLNTHLDGDNIGSDGLIFR